MNPPRRERPRKGAGHHVRRLAVMLERRWDAVVLARRAGRPPDNLRIDPYLGHGSDTTAVVRGRVLDNPEPATGMEGVTVWAAIRRNLARFNTRELPGVPLLVRVGDTEIETETDEEGYFSLRFETDLTGTREGWVIGEIGLRVPYRGLIGDYSTGLRIRVPGPGAGFGVISDVDDTILHTETQRALTMLRNTLTGSVRSRTPIGGAAELYRALAAGEPGPNENPFFYVSSSPWNLHGFLAAFLEYRRFPAGPLLLRDLLGGDADRSHHSHKSKRIDEVLELHPGLAFVLIGDSAQDDPGIYEEVVRRHPARIVAVYLREARLGPSDGRVETIIEEWNHDVPVVLAVDPAMIAEHAASLGLIEASDVATIRRASRANPVRLG